MGAAPLLLCLPRQLWKDEIIMMSGPIPPFTVSREQASRLQGYIQTYRQYALTSFMPSTERNVTLRGLQMLQGKLIEIRDQKATPLQLVLNREAVTVLKSTINEFLALYAKQPESAERIATLSNLAALKNSLKHY